MTNVATMPVAQGAVGPGAAVAAIGKGGRGDSLFGDLLAVAVDGPVVQQPGAGKAVPDELASLMAMFMPANPTPFVATLQQPAIAGSQTPIATGSESPISKAGVVIDPADVLARLVQPATPGVTQDTPVPGGQARINSFRAVLDRLTPTASGESGAGSQTPIATGSESPILRAGVVIDSADVLARLVQPATPGVTQDAPLLSGQARLDRFGAVLDQLTPTTSGDPGAVQVPATGADPKGTVSAPGDRATVQPAEEAEGIDPTDAKTVRRSAGQAPSEAFMIARQPAHDAGETQPLDTTRQVLTAKLTADRSGEQVASTVQVDSRPAGDNGASAQDNARSAASMLARAEPFHQAMTEATATRARETTRTDADLSRRVIDQVVREVSVHRLQGRTDMVVKLNPPDLGTLRLHVVQDAHGMTSQIQTTNEQVRGLLQAHLPALVDALSGVGVKLNSVSITSDPSFGALMHNSAQGGNQQQPDVPRRQFAGLPGDTAGTISSTGLHDAPSNGVGYSWLA